MREKQIDERAAELLREDFERLPEELKTPPAAVSGGPVSGSVEDFPRDLAGAVDGAIWEHNKLYNLAAQNLPQFRERLFPIHLSLGLDGTWHVEEGEKCKHPLDANYSFHIRPSMTRDTCRSAASGALKACVSYLGRESQTSPFERSRTSG